LIPRPEPPSTPSPADEPAPEELPTAPNETAPSEDLFPDDAPPKPKSSEPPTEDLFPEDTPPETRPKSTVAPKTPTDDLFREDAPAKPKSSTKPKTEATDDLFPHNTPKPSNQSDATKAVPAAQSSGGNKLRKDAAEKSRANGDSASLPRRDRSQSGVGSGRVRLGIAPNGSETTAIERTNHAADTATTRTATNQVRFAGGEIDATSTHVLADGNDGLDEIEFAGEPDLGIR
jgi:hypothetical protein